MDNYVQPPSVKYTLGLTLSGGGAKCMAHIGLLQYLAENGIEPDIISATSGGAVIGALHAAGCKPVHILEFFLKHRMFCFQNLSLNQWGLIQSEKIGKYFEKYFPDNSFEALKKPLFVVATDLQKPAQHVFSSGPLIKPLLGASAFPGVLTPVRWGNEILADGGIINNFPASLIREQCHFQIGMHLTPVRQRSEEHFRNARSLLERVYDIFSVSKIVKEIRIPDIVLEPEGLEEFGTFSVKNDDLEAMFELGYECAQKYFSGAGRQWFMQLQRAMLKRPQWLMDKQPA
ncbi:putative NTE family protein [invertebrate metagenome]|uniref:Putative NTE family protein n=1 Tax=invertebrate metagenome TaxID=1711999 RepID=A0A2H9TAB5_9ZZZZ